MAADLTTIAREFHAGRREARRTHAIYNLKADGTRYARTDRYANSAEEAQRIHDRLVSMNPGQKFEIVEL
jgi:hypothetical protein